MDTSLIPKEDLYVFNFNVPQENTWSNDPSLSLKVITERMCETSQGISVGVEITGIEYTNKHGKRESLDGSIIGAAIRIKNWPDVYQQIQESAKIEFEQRQHVQAAQELTNKVQA